MKSPKKWPDPPLTIMDRKERCCELIEKVVISKFTGKLEINVTQGAITNLKKEENIKI